MNAVKFFDSEEEMINIQRITTRGVRTEVHLADLHFTAIDPKIQYDILMEQVINKINMINHIDLISVNGDIFDKKIMSNSNGALYATLFIDKLISVAKSKNATIVLIHGTYSHDADQLKLFYHYLNDTSIDIRIVTTIQFEYIKGAKYLCIPELYGVDESVYQKVLFQSGYYDGVLMHGTIKGSVYGDNVGNGRLFTIEDFIKCKGPIMSGHIHKSGCFNKYFYYSGTPIRYKFGEEEPKGFMIVLRDLDNRMHYTHFEEVVSFKYITIELSDIINNDPRVVIDYINNLRLEQNIDFLKVRFMVPVDGANKTVMNNYYRNNHNIKVEFLDKEKELEKKREEEINENDKFSFILNDSLSDEEKYCRYVNIMEGYEFITVEKLKEILDEKSIG